MRENRLRFMRFPLLTVCGLLLAVLPIQARDYHFDGSMSEEVLRSYLSRSMTMMYLLTGHGDLDDNIRMLKNCGVKFVGRSVYVWGREEGGEADLPNKLAMITKNAAKVHEADSDIILQACVFEIVSSDCEKVAIPDWVFKGLGLPVEGRHFRYEDIIYQTGRGQNQWGRGSSVPDVSRPETKLWFYYLAGSYINAGCEAIHFGQAELMNKNDRDLAHWADILTAVREYAHQHARRHFVLCDAHVPGGGLVRDGKLLLDFHAFPLRIAETPERPREGTLRVGFSDGIYGRSKGGLTPSGWKCEHLPFLVEFDNYGRSKMPGQSGMGGCWVWGWDEITWFAQQDEKYRNDWLRFAWQWVREHDAEGYVEMPGYRCLVSGPNGKRWYYVNEPSKATPEGFGQEATIKAIWASDSDSVKPHAAK